MSLKKRKVLIVYPDFVENSAGTQLKGSYSEGIASISAVLKQSGHEVALYHMREMATKEEFLTQLREHDADIVAFSIWTRVFRFVKEMLVWTKEKTRAFTVCGGYHATLSPDEVIAARGADCVCIGEGEYPLLDLCERLGDKEALYKTENLWFNVEGEIIKNPVRPFIGDLDALPAPDMELFDFGSFLSSRIKTAIVMVSRGCLFSCTYCANSRLREVYPESARYARFKSPAKAVAYLQSILDKYPYIEYFNFMDSVLNMKRAWFEEFIVLYAQKLRIPFCCRTRADLLNEKTVRLLKEANCYMVDIGVESGDEAMRREILHRNMSDEMIVSAFAYLNEYKISTLAFNIVGLPHEDIRKSLKTVKLNARIRPTKIVVSIFSPFPHTRLTEMAKEAGFLADEADFTKEVVCKQPQYPDAQIIFAQQYFTIFVKLFKFAYACPKWLGRPLEKLFDFLFVCRKPYGLLVFLRRGWVRMLHGAKRLLMKFSPKLYVKLRDKSVKYKKPEAAAKKEEA
ncbi:MAG: B12-binding domain-containing radical SAM protein [Clostridiales bacterium]|nr:B12-binding domain-containing radical SAM protein [Clostridiales bacterium]